MKKQYSKKFMMEALAYWKKQLNDYDSNHSTAIAKPKTFYTKSFVNEALAYWYDQLNKHDMMLEAINSKELDEMDSIDIDSDRSIGNRSFDQGKMLNRSRAYTRFNISDDAIRNFLVKSIIQPSIDQNVWSANIKDIQNKFIKTGVQVFPDDFDYSGLDNPDYSSEYDNHTSHSSELNDNPAACNYLFGDDSAFDDEETTSDVGFGLDSDEYDVEDGFANNEDDAKSAIKGFIIDNSDFDSGTNVAIRVNDGLVKNNQAAHKSLYDIEHGTGGLNTENGSYYFVVNVNDWN